MSKPRLRVVLAQPRGFCAGVERAITIVERALERFGPPVYVRHEIVHNKHVVEALKSKGARFVDDVDEIPEGAVTVFSAHGVAEAVEIAGQARELEVIDATCPLVTKVHKEGQRYASKGYEVILIGHAGHPEVEGTMGRINGPVHLISDAQEVASLQPANPDKLAFVTQTTLSVDDTREVIRALKARFPTIVGPDTRDICYATQNRQTAVRALSRRGRPDPGGRRPEQLELESAARDRRDDRHAELPDRQCRQPRPELARRGPAWSASRPALRRPSSWSRS